jgi:hypothetical protein
MKLPVVRIPSRTSITHPDAVEAVGFSLLVLGLALVYIPAALIVSGVLLVAVAFLTDVKRRPPGGES